MGVTKSRNEIPTIDVNLVTIQTEEGEFGFDTANQIEVEAQTEDTDAVRLVVKGILRAQKPMESTITGHQITLHDNVFNPQLVKVLQGGTIYYYQDEAHLNVGIIPTNFGVARYTPPMAGSNEKGQIFTLNAYSAIYNAAGVITGYEKTIYPNCQGVPVAFNSEDGAFRAPEYTINSAPDIGDYPYDIVFVDELPELTDPDKADYTITVNPAGPLEYDPDGDNTFDLNGMFTVSPFSSNKTYKVTYGGDIASVADHTLTYSGAGTVVVRLNVAQDETHNAASASGSVTISLKNALQSPPYSSPTDDDEDGE